MSLSTTMSLQQLDSSRARLFALDRISEAFAEAALDGVDAEAFAEAALATALRELVAVHGETRIADALAKLPERVLAGEFSLQVRQ